MNPKVINRLLIYAILGFVTFSQEGISDIPGLDPNTVAWVKYACGAILAALIPIRAFMDQTIARENGDKEPKQ